MRKGKLLARGNTAEIYEWGDREVIKIFVTPERVMNEVENSNIVFAMGLRVPRVKDVVKLEDGEGIVYEKIEGPTLMRSMEATESSLLAHARLMAKLHADLHRVTTAITPNLLSELSRGIGRERTLTAEQRSEAAESLKQLPEGNTICHYDFHPDNIIMSPNGPIIIDWLNALIGHPEADVMRTLVILRARSLPPDPPAWLQDRKYRLMFSDAYLEEYRKLRDVRMDELIRWTAPTVANRLSEIPQGEEALWAEMHDFARRIAGRQ